MSMKDFKNAFLCLSTGALFGYLFVTYGSDSLEQANYLDQMRSTLIGTSLGAGYYCNLARKLSNNLQQL